MNRIFIIILVFTTIGVFAIPPKFSIKIKANATDILVDENHLFIASDIGEVYIFNISTKKKIQTIKLPFYIDFMGDTVSPKIFDIEINRQTKDLCIVSQTIGGFTDVFMYRHNTLHKIIDKDDRYMIKKIVFYNQTDVLIGLLSNEIVRFNIKEKKVVYKTQISSYTFSDMCLSQKGGRIISSDESGRVNILSATDGKVILIHEGENLDNVYKIDYKGSCIATAGQDRRLGIYLFHPFSSYHIQSNFLIYAVALSPSGKKAAYLSNENNDLTLINTQTMEVLATLEGHSAIVNSIVFVNENAIFSSADEPIVYYWEF